MLQLSKETTSVCTHSSGNHAQALAYAAATLKIPAYIVMPQNSPAVKKKAVEGYGATVV
jgi:threonine dehydratase